MRKQLLLSLLIAGAFFFSAGGVYAQHLPGNDSISLPGAENNGWITEKQCPFTPVQLGIAPFFGVFQVFASDMPVYGLTLGVLTAFQESSVITAAPVSILGNNYGLSVGALANFSACNYGIQTGLVNLAGKGEPDRWGGIQIGLFNAADGVTFQLGLLNYNAESLLPWCPLINFSRFW